MNQVKKRVAGAAVVVIAAGAGMPAITGYMLENNIQEKLEQSAEKYDFAVSSVDIDRSFAETTISVMLEGEGLRTLSQESLQLNGTLKHSNLLGLPNLVTADLDFTYFMYQQGIKLGLPGSASGTVSWNGAIEAVINSESFELPLDPDGSAIMILEPTSGLLSIDGRGDKRDVELNLNSLNWSIKDNNNQLMSFTVKPSRITVSSSGEQWSMSVPELSLTTNPTTNKNSLEANLTLADIQVNGEQKVAESMLSSRLSIEAGQLTVPALAPLQADKVIEGFTMTSRVENISDSSITQLAVLMQEMNLLDNQDTVEKAARQFLVELAAGNPKVALENFTLKTANGDLGISFDFEGTEKSGELLETLTNSPDLTLEQEDQLGYELMTTRNSSAKVTLSEDLIGWSCERIGEQAATKAEGQFLSNMCKTMADSGDFLSAPCMDVANPEQQAQCMDTMEQVKTVWANSKTLELAMKDGKLQLNGATVDLPALM